MVAIKEKKSNLFLGKGKSSCFIDLFETLILEGSNCFEWENGKSSSWRNEGIILRHSMRNVNLVESKGLKEAIQQVIKTVLGLDLFLLLGYH